MYEIIAAILGAVIGGYLAWRFSRYRPKHIICEERFRSEICIGGPLKNWSAWWNTSERGARFSLLIGLPNTRVLFQDEAVDKLTFLTLVFRNTSDKPINNASILVKLDDEARVLGCKSAFKPERHVGSPSSESLGPLADRTKLEPCCTAVDKSKLQLEIDTIFPYKLNQEILTLDIICSGKAGEPEILGQGTLDDGNAWAARFEHWEETERRAYRRLRAIGRALLLGFALYSAYFVYFVLRTYPRIRRNDRLAWLLTTPQVTVCVGYLLIQLVYLGYLLLYKKMRLRIPIPFSKRRLVIRSQPTIDEHQDRGERGR